MDIPMSDKMNFAVIGCGSLARSQHIPNIAQSTRAVLHTCCDLSDTALAECRDIHGAQHITKDFHAAVKNPEVHAIVLAATEKLRLPVIAACAEAGKPVYVEKPLAKDLDEAYAIQKIVHQSGIHLCVGHNRRASPAMIDAHRIYRQHMRSPQPRPWRWEREGKGNRPALADDGVGSMSVRINDDWYSWKGWVFDKTQAPHGPMLFEMTHFTDLCNWFLDDEPVEAVAIESGMLNHGVVIRYANGGIATIHMGSNGTHAYPKELYEVMGNGGIVAIDHMLEVRTAGITDAPLRTCYPTLTDKYPAVGTGDGLQAWLEKQRHACDEVTRESTQLTFCAADPDKGHARAIEQFIDEVRGGTRLLCDVDSAILSTRVAFAAIRSAHEKRFVKISEV